ncbi:MAG: hypothetical protein K2Y31_17905 [Burkholderiales bacterium]|nr:hypothetical protein [Burkholderiales bacterium]
MSQSLRQSRWIIALFCIVVGVAGGPARAQVNPELANCEELRDETTRTQVNFCTAHVGCALVMRIHKVCASVKTFLNRLNDLSLAKLEPDMNDVFDAAAPPVDNDPAYTRAAQTLRSAYANQSDKELRTGTTEKGTTWVYQGPIVDGRWNGTAIYASSSGSMARAEFVNGRQVGKGEFTNLRYRSIGDTRSFLREGKGIQRYENGDRYEGQFSTHLPHGRGIMTFISSGDVYEGDFAKGRLSGQGTLTSPGGNKYEGAFLDGHFHGQGTLSLKSGERLTGEFRNSKPFNAEGRDALGRVVATYSNGSVTRTTTSTETASGSGGLGEFLGILGAVAGAVIEHREARRQTGSSTTPSSPATSSSPQPAAVTSSSPARPQASPAESPPPSGGNPDNDATHCVRAISEAEIRSLGIRTTTSKGFLNRCAFPIVVVYCYVGGDCNPGYTNLSTSIDSGRFYPLAGGGRSVTIAYGACRSGSEYGFGKGNHIANREMKHICN